MVEKYEEYQWSYYGKNYRVEISYPKQEYKSKSKFIYETNDFILSGQGSSSDQQLLAAYQDDAAIMLSKGMEMVEEDIVLLLRQDGVEEDESNGYSLSLIPFYTTQLMNYKHVDAEPLSWDVTDENDGLKTTILDASLDNFHAKLDGHCQKIPHSYDITGKFLKLDTDYWDLSTEEKTKIDHGKTKNTSFQIYKEEF